MSNQDYEIEIYFMNNRAMQPKINISVLKCDDETFPNENINKCVTCQELNKYYSKERKSCLSSCESNEYSYEHTCYDKCPDRTYLYNIKHICLDNCDNHEYDTKLGENNECIDKTFELNEIEPKTLNRKGNETITLFFKENITENRLINISISNFKSTNCTYKNISTYECLINLSSFSNSENEFSINYEIKKGDNSTLSLNSSDIKVKISDKYGKDNQEIQRTAAADRVPVQDQTHKMDRRKKPVPEDGRQECTQAQTHLRELRLA